MILLSFLKRLSGSALVRATLGVAGLGLGVKLVALLKDMAVASRLGVSREMDTFSLAFGFASLLVSLFAGNLNAAFIPSYARLGASCNHSTARALYQILRRRLGLALGLLSLGLAATSVLWVPWLTPRWSVADQTHLRHLLFLLLAWVPLAGAALLSAAALQGEERFTAPALLPALSSLAILGTLALSTTRSAFPLGWGVLIGASAEMLALAWVLRRYAPPREAVGSTALREALPTVGRQYLPTLAAGLLINTTPLVDYAIAGWLPPGAIATLAYASKVPAVALTLSAGALGTTLLPALSRMAGEEQWAAIRRLVLQASLLAFGAGTLGALLLGACSPRIVHLLFQRGAFGAEQVPEVSGVQVLYLLQLPFALGSTVMVRLISALQGNHLLLWGTIISAMLNVGLDLLFLPRLGARGISLSTTCVAAVACAFLSFWALRLLRSRERRAL